MTPDTRTTENPEPRTEAACPTCGHDVDHTTACPDGCPMCPPTAVERLRRLMHAVAADLDIYESEQELRDIVDAALAEAAQGAVPRWQRPDGSYSCHAPGQHPPDEGAAPRAEGLERAIGLLMHEGYEIRHWPKDGDGEFGIVSAQEFSETLAARLAPQERRD